MDSRPSSTDHDHKVAGHAAHKHQEASESRHEHEQHDHSTGHGHNHDEHDHDSSHDHSSGPIGRLREAIPFLHGHSHGEVNVDKAMESSDRGIWALKVSLLGLGLTAAFQIIVFVISGSVGLLADTIHNASDALTAVPLWFAFVIGRRKPSESYTYGYGRVEDLAGVVIVLMIAASAIVAAYESLVKLLNPTVPSNLIWVAVAAVVGFIGNEAVAILRIRVGNEIGSAALVADGQHARVDGLTSLAVLVGAVGVWLGFPLADPIVGLLITVAILFIVKDSAIVIWRRVMDAIDPEIIKSLKNVASDVVGVEEVSEVRARWLGHRLEADMHISVNEELSTKESHRIAEEVRHGLFHAQPKLVAVNIHVDPCGHSGEDAHASVAHHQVRG